MGRRPNQVILEYFERGAKLDDASNRYQQTCKKCGGMFPKGRVDNLVAHITKKCPAISLSERTQVVLRLHSIIGPDGKTPENTRLDKGKAIELPYSPSRKENFDGLNVLAEASRRVGATSHPHEKMTAPAEGGRNVPVDPALQISVDAFPGGFLNSPDEAFNSRANGTSTESLAPLLPPIFSFGTTPHPESQDGTNGIVSIDTSLPSQLSSIAASANDMMTIEPDVDMSSDNISSTLFNQLGGLSAVLNEQNGNHMRSVMNWSAISQEEGIERDVLPTSASGATNITSFNITNNRNNNGPRPIAINPESRQTHFISESGTSARTQRPKVRGRFTAERRKEVQNIRKRGACMRCRVLKKPCSSDAPCASCSGVDNARIWKYPCVRTRLVDEFSLIAAGLHSSLAFHDVHNIKAAVEFEVAPIHVEACHIEMGAATMVLSVLRGKLPQADASSTANVFVPSPAPAVDVIILDGDSDDLSSKIEQYLLSMKPRLINREPSKFLQATLLFASNLTEETHDDLLSTVLELWSATTLLTDKELLWNIVASIDEAVCPPNSPSHPAEEPNRPQKTTIERDNPFSHSLIDSQLRALIESRARILSKATMSRIEKRLINRQNNKHFETFLACLIFLNCVERFCWLFRTWAVNESHDAKWPLDTDPQMYADQGARITDVVNMLLKMRQLSAKNKPLLEKGVIMPADEERGLSTKWFVEVNIDESFLDEAMRSEFNCNDSRSLDGTCFARVLKPGPAET